MKTINTLLAKMNSNTSESITLNDLAPLSLHEIYALSEEKLSWHEAKTLYKEAQETAKINKLNEAHYLARNNPQVRNAITLGIQPSPVKDNDLSELLNGRDTNYVNSKSVASMFSPAGYLTELYREARALHAKKNIHHLDKRRPDLAQLVLSQENMDKQVSTLSLSNQILTTALQNRLGRDKDLFRELATHRLTGENPYHQPYETIRQALLLHDDVLDKLVKAKDNFDNLDTEWISAINSSISPELYAILTEVISDDNVDELVEKNFGDKNISLKNNLKFISEYYSIPEKEVSPLINKLKVDNDLSSKDMLTLNKIIRLHKATGISLDNLIILIQTKNDQLNVDPEVIRAILHIQYIVEKYNINVEQSIVLNGSNINQQPIDQSLPLFDILFNSPPLGKNKFIADNKALDFNSSSSDDVVRINTLKRAFNVDDIGIVAMWKLASGKQDGFTCSIENISLLYRVYLLSTVHGLDIYSLSLLLEMLSKPFDKPISEQSLSDDAGKLIYTIDNYCHFLTKYKLNISELYLMTSKNYDLTYTREIEKMVEELSKIKFETDDPFLFEIAVAYVPIISYHLQQPSSIYVQAIIKLLDYFKITTIDAQKFESLVNKEDKDQNDKNNIVMYIQELRQWITISNRLGLNENELSSLSSGHVIKKRIVITDVNLIKLLSEFHEFYLDKISGKEEINRVFSNNNMASNLSKIYEVNEDVIKQIMSLLKIGNEIHFYDIELISSYIDIIQTVNLTPNNFNLLTQLKFSVNSGEESDFLLWDRASKILQSGLNPQQTILLNNSIDEKKSTALSDYVINQFKGLNLKNRDDIYQYLLIDNKVSSEIMTTKIAQAIASIQLYVNRCLSNSEPRTVGTVKSRQFFKDWENYNKRYSTWRGISLLAYYPENYIDPTVRIGQTKMMDNLLQTVSQNSINNDTIEDAFKTYLTSFEQIANLEVISGYHDGDTLDEGITYFIGRNASEKMSYYWRSADHSKIKDGVMAANAWTEWTKIDNGSNPYNNLIRPVIFNNRLYIAWIETQEIAKTAEKGSIEIHKETVYSLKLSHIRYDGTWSSSIDFPLDDTFIKDEMGNFHLSYNQDIDKLFILTYIVNSSYSDESENYHVYSIGNEMKFSQFPVSNANKLNAKNIYLNVKLEFDIIDKKLIKKINNKFLLRGQDGYVISRDPVSDIKNNDSTHVSLHGSTVNGVGAELKSDVVTCYLSSFVNCNINYGEHAPEPIKKIFNSLLNNNSKLKDIVYVYGDVGEYSPFSFSFNNATNYSYYLGFDVENNIVYFFIYDNVKKSVISNNEVNQQGDYSVLLTFFTNQSNGVIKKYSSKNMAAFTLSKELTDFSLQEFLYKETPRFIFSVSGSYETDLIMGAYGKEVSYPLSINSNNLKKVIYDEDEIVSDIKIKLSSSKDNEMEYSLDKWSNANTSLIEGSNNFTSVDKVLNLGIPINEFKNNGKVVLTASIKAVNKKGIVISESIYDFEVKELVNIKDSVISLKTNPKHAQYISMTVANKLMLVRLNTLFARQLVKRANNGIDAILTLDTQNLPEPALGEGADVSMDFNGANALYFWELFYYTPMMIANVMLEGQNYDEASRWLRYVFSPNGYIDGDVYTGRVWNSQPLLADTTWDKNQLDSTDPDAVAQTDPMHYKLATFMKCLDILMARGDSAYRLLERDTLNEAKMWYIQALKLLGDEVELFNDEVWSAPKLTEAATKTKQSTRSASEEREETVSPRTANSLTELFLPQINEKLAQYRDTLNVRLFNLRHNLSIDGQPLSLAIYATPADPKALQNAAVNRPQGEGALPKAIMPMQRFPVMLNSAKSVVNQLIEFGSSLANITERQDAQALSELLATQGNEITIQNIKHQQKTIEEFDHNENSLWALLEGAQKRYDYYSKLYNENVSSPETKALALRAAGVAFTAISQPFYVAAGLAVLAPNTFGMAVGGSNYGGPLNAAGTGFLAAATTANMSSDILSQSEIYRRRREEWGSLRDTAQSELEQIDAQIKALDVRKKAANLQLGLLTLQQTQTQAHLTFLQNKFTNKALYNWLRGKLMAIYKPFYDLAVSRCRMAEYAYQYDLDKTEATFIRPDAWQGAYSGLMAGESLMHNLTQMESSYLEEDKRVLEVSKIVSLEEVYQNLSSNKFGFDQIAKVINQPGTQLGTKENGISLKDGQLQASIKLSDLAIGKDYPAGLGKSRRVKQISVTLPMLTGTYQNIRAVLNYGGNTVHPRGCSAIAISHGMNDSGQFQLNFNDDRYLPFEGLPVDDTSTLTLSFPDATDKQKEMLLTLSDIVLHINYTIR